MYRFIQFDLGKKTFEIEIQSILIHPPIVSVFYLTNQNGQDKIPVEKKAKNRIVFLFQTLTKNFLNQIWPRTRYNSEKSSYDSQTLNNTILNKFWRSQFPN